MAERRKYRYDRLDAGKLVETLQARSRKIQEVFPGSGLAGIADSLTQVCSEAIQGSLRQARPNWPRRIMSIVALLIIVLVAATLIDIVANTLMRSGRVEDLSRYGIVLPIGLAGGVSGLPLMFFWLLTWEARWKRQHCLKEMHRLRCLVHVIDMHQLTKDPGAAVVTDINGKRPMKPGELVTYLDICTDLLSLAGKIAVLYAQSTYDPAVLEAVSDLEEITTNLSVKIWQKISVVQSTGNGAGVVPV